MNNEKCLKLLALENTDVNYQIEEFLIQTIIENDIGKNFEKLLASKNIDINYQDKLGNTALIWAAWMGHDKCVELLLKAGAKIDVQNEGGDTALMCATLKGHDKCVELIQEASKENRNEQ